VPRAEHLVVGWGTAGYLLDETLQRLEIRIGHASSQKVVPPVSPILITIVAVRATEH